MTFHDRIHLYCPAGHAQRVARFRARADIDGRPPAGRGALKLRFGVLHCCVSVDEASERTVRERRSKMLGLRSDGETRWRKPRRSTTGTAVASPLPDAI